MINAQANSKFDSKFDDPADFSAGVSAHPSKADHAPSVVADGSFLTPGERFDANTEVQKRSFTNVELLLECGVTLKNVQMGYETYGQLNQDRSNAIMISHYFTGSSHAAGRYLPTDAEPGYWDTLIGPGKGIDTDKYFVIATDSLCNLYTKSPYVITTGPTTIRPETGLPWGPDFPVVTLADNVKMQKSLCDAMGITKLHAVAGPSMGSLQSMEWTARFPEMVDRAICVIPAGLQTDAYLIALLNTWMAPIRLDKNFRGGHYYGQEEPVAGLTEALKLVTFNAVHYKWAKRLYARRWADADKNPLMNPDNDFSIETALEQTAQTRAASADANSFLRLAQKVQLFNIADRKDRLRAKYLFVPAQTDLLMFPEYAEEGVRELRALGLQADIVEIPGDGGHLDGLALVHRAEDSIRRFLEN